jgi:hypothetical protein
VRAKRKGTFILGSVAAMALLLALAGTASARTTGMTIVNLTKSPVKISELVKHSSSEGARVIEPIAPKKNQTIGLGEQIHVEIENPVFQYRNVQIYFSGQSLQFRVELENGEYPRCQVYTQPLQCRVEKSTVTFLEPKGTVVEINSGNLQAQAEALKGLCSEANECEFEPLTEDPKAETASRVVGDALYNCNGPGEPNQKTTLTYNDKVSITDSVGVEVDTGFEIYKVFKENIKLKYNHERTVTHEFTQAVELVVLPERVGWVFDVAPVIRDTGNFKLKAGNTEYKINGVSFESPDPSRSGAFGTDHEKLTPEQMAKDCTHHKGIVMMPPSSVKVESKGSPAADLLRGGPEANTLRGFGGNDLIRGGGGDDTLIGGPGNDLIKGGPGADTLFGGPGADRMDDVSGPTVVWTGSDNTPVPDRVDVADGVGDDTVHCQTSNTVVFADPGDEILGPCGRVVLSSE